MTAVTPSVKPRRPADEYRTVAEAGWRWVLDQVRWDDEGPWVPACADDDAAGAPGTAPADRDGMHSGVGGLGLALAEVRLARPWTDEERSLADAVGARLRRAIPEQRDVTYFDGLASTIGVLLALGQDGVEQAVARIAALASADGWEQAAVGPPRYAAGARVNDLTLGTAGVLAAAVWAHRHGVDGAEALADRAADVLQDEAVPTPHGTTWPFVPQRFQPEPRGEMPNYSHGLAGVAAVLAAAGSVLGRVDLVAAARSGAEHLVSLADLTGGGFAVPIVVPQPPADRDPVTYTWCHGPTGTSLLFLALDRAGVEDVAGAAPVHWHRRCLTSVHASGLPERRYPGFWDNDGRCCGTAGVGDVLLDAWTLGRHDDDLDLALQCADALVERAVREGRHACWRFVEHRAEQPLLPPGVGWMQGAAGIAAYLFRASRVATDPDGAPALGRMDTWWALP